jgi:glycosyltransferase involved in cell wall biosynthesis
MPMDSTHNGSRPMFSVIITNYNYARYLRQCIETVLSQDYPNVEIIVVDDCSHDESKSVIESFGARVKALFKPNGGVVSSCNSGWLHARGDMILILDADDFLLPGALSVHAKALSGDDVVRSQAYLMIVNADGQPTGHYYPRRRPQDSGLRENVLTFGPGGYFSTATSGNAWSRSFFERVFPLQETRIVSCDALLFDIAPLYGQTVTTETTVAAYRFHGASMQDGKARFTAQNISAILDAYDFRARRLRDTAELLGYEVHVARWRARNWRIATLRYIRGRLVDLPEPPSLIQHLASASACRNPIKGLAVFLAIFAMRLLPISTSAVIASKMIKLQEM